MPYTVNDHLQPFLSVKYFQIKIWPLGKDKIKRIFVKPFVKTSWVIEEVTYRPTGLQKKWHSRRFLRTLSHSNIKCTKHQGLNIQRKACLQRIVGFVFDTDYSGLKGTMTVQK